MIGSAARSSSADAFLLGQRMGQRQHQHVLPFVAGQGHQFLVVGQRLGGDADLRDFVDHHAGHLVRRALVQADVDLGVRLAQFRHRHRQHVARLGVGGGDRQGAAVLRAELLADALEVAYFAHDQLDALEHMLAGLGHALEPLAVAGENLHAQFLLQLDDGFGNAGLGGVQGLCGFGQVQVAPHRLLHESELMEVHTEFLLREEFIMPQRLSTCELYSRRCRASRSSTRVLSHRLLQRECDRRVCAAQVLAPAPAGLRARACRCPGTSERS